MLQLGLFLFISLSFLFVSGSLFFQLVLSACLTACMPSTRPACPSCLLPLPRWRSSRRPLLTSTGRTPAARPTLPASSRRVTSRGLAACCPSRQWLPAWCKAGRWTWQPSERRGGGEEGREGGEALHAEGFVFQLQGAEGAGGGPCGWSLGCVYGWDRGAGTGQIRSVNFIGH